MKNTVVKRILPALLLLSAILTNLASEDNLKIKEIPGNTWGR